MKQRDGEHEASEGVREKLNSFDFYILESTKSTEQMLMMMNIKVRRTLFFFPRKEQSWQRKDKDKAPNPPSSFLSGHQAFI